uniref:ATPase family AAA domain containing 5 n=1 Tax=Poecilia latipinna TaxID=48699 RepID=A0A3B3UJ42_9TELE
MKRNKLKRNKTKQNKDGHHRHVGTAVIVLSDGGCSDGGTSQEKPSAAGSEERESSLCKGFKIAPIFLRTNQHAKIKGRSDGGSYQTEHKSMSPSQSDDVQSQLPHLTGRRGPVSCREQQLPASHLESCLKAIQKSNPAFPVSTVFSTLLKKGSQRLHESEPAGEVSQRCLPECALISIILLHFFFHLRAFPPSRFNDVLWTDKYVPQHSSEIIGNSVSVNKLHSWLKNWKRRADGDERSQMAERKRDENAGSWDCGDFQGEAGLEDRGAEPLGKAMLLSGPSGVGKTAAVYACAQELGFKVFEVNCSSQRSGRHVLSQLKETTQSHLVEIPGEDPLKPAYFNNYSANSCTPKPETLPAKLQFPKNIVSTSKKRAARNSSSRKFRAKPATVTLARYFKAKTGKAKTEAAEYSSAGCDQEVPHNKKTATSLILFEEVDVVFDDDVGFLTAIKAFMTTTKRPVVMTTNDPSFKERFGCNLDEITFKTPPSANVCSYLQLVCLAENFQLPPDDASSLFKLACGDVRRSLLQLQLWVNGSKGLQGGELAEEPVSSRPGEEVCLFSTPTWKVSPTRNKSSRLSRRRFTASASASRLTSRPQKAPSFTETRDKPEKRAAKAVTDCLDGLADFFDLMSSIDATLPHYVSGPHAAEAFVWTGADLKDGLSDEPREEDSRSLKQGRLQDMKAAAEGLGCRQCWWRVTEAWTDAYRCKQKLNDKQWNRLQRRLLLTGCSKSQNLRSRQLLSSESFSLLGNRRAVYVDYLPALRLVRHAVGAQQHHLGRWVTDAVLNLTIVESFHSFIFFNATK